MVLGFRIFFPLLFTRQISPFSMDSFRSISKKLRNHKNVVSSIK